MDDLLMRTRPIPGRPGWRIDEEGREWYSDEWLDDLRDPLSEVSLSSHPLGRLLLRLPTKGGK